jgi:catechol 2,3-dioxygenase-like lactoylglutathione lyase family enzyme
MAALTDMAGWLDHIVITVSDLGVSTQFYDEVLTLIGFRRIRDVPEGPLWAGERIEVGLQKARAGHARNHDRYSPGLHHLAFGAPDHAAVDRMYQALVSLGVEVLDPPTTYDRYSLGYYAVFFADPDGIKLEYVYTPKWPTE